VPKHKITLGFQTEPDTVAFCDELAIRAEQTWLQVTSVIKQMDSGSRNRTFPRDGCAGPGLPINGLGNVSKYPVFDVRQHHTDSVTNDPSDFTSYTAVGTDFFLSGNRVTLNVLGDHSV